MEDAEIERRFHLLQTEIESTGSLMSDLKVDWLAAMNSVRIEVETLKSYLDHYHPSFGENYAALRQEAIQSVDPEWIVIKMGAEGVTHSFPLEGGDRAGKDESRVERSPRNAASQRR